MTLEETSQENSLIHQEHTYFSAMLSKYDEPQIFLEAWHHKYLEKCEGWHTFKDMINKGVWRKPKRRN